VTSIIPSERTSLAKGLRALADHLESAAHSPRCAEVMLLPIVPQDGREYAVVCVNSIAATETGANGSTAVPWNFGPITYKITLSPRILLGNGER
jgi:hypothetical protein